MPRYRITGQTHRIPESVCVRFGLYTYYITITLQFQLIYRKYFYCFPTRHSPVKSNIKANIEGACHGQGGTYLQTYKTMAELSI